MKKIYLAALFSTFCFFSQKGSADVVGIRTATPVGESISIALNAGCNASIAWSNGQTESIIFTGEAKSIPVKSDSLTITSDGEISLVYVPSCNLTYLNVVGTSTNLKQLFCQDNKLQTLNVASNTGLVEINCDGNMIDNFSVKGLVKLNKLNCARNGMSTLDLGTTAGLVSLVCSDNALTSLVVTRHTKLQQLWCHNNKLTTLSISRCTDLRGLFAFNNEMTGMIVGSKEKLRDIWVENNKLDSLYLQSSAKLETVSINDNNLNDAPLNDGAATSLKSYYAQNNSLFINSLPTVYNKITGKDLMNYIISPQRPYVLFDKAEIAVKNNLINVVTKNSFSQNIAPVFSVYSANDDTKLKMGASEDYTWSLSKLTFNKIFEDGVYLSVTSPYYPEQTFTTKSFVVYDPSIPIGIVGVENDANTTSGSEIYDLQGRKVVNPQHGIYIVRGKGKIVK